MAAPTSIPQPATDAATPQLPLEFEEPDVAPIARLPPELLGDIFLLTLPTITPSTVGPHLFNPRLTSPWSLGQVCSQWRVLALSLSTLWASLAIPTRMTARVLYLLTVQLERSRQAPLHVLIKCSTRWRGDRLRSYEQAYTTILQTIARECHRWRMIWLELNATWLPKAAFENLGKMPLLTELKLSGAYPFIPAVFANAPSLCRVTLSDIGTRSVPPNIRLPWRQITTYKATYPSASFHCANIFAAAATLVECDINNEQHNGWNAQDLTLALPRLRRLVVGRELLFGGLTTPALLELYVASSSAAHSTIGLIVRSTCVLTRLTLVQCAAPANEIVDLLTHTPALTALEIQFASGTPDSGTPNALLAALAGAGLVPRLAALAWADFTDRTDRAAFADMVEARWRMERRLRFVAIYLCRLRMKASGLRLRALMSEGLDVVILNARKGRTAIKRWREY